VPAAAPATPAATLTTTTTNAAALSPEAQKLLEAVNQQGVVVRDLKANKATKTDIDAAVASLLSLKVFILL
jgi:hypothetical protein